MKSIKIAKIKDFILHNLWLKILSVILAVFIWIVIVNVDNPRRTRTITGIEVVLLNESSLTEKGYTYAVQSGSTVSITIKAPSSVAESLEASDFYAYADLSETSLVSDSAEIKVRCEKADVANQVDIVSKKSDYIKLLIDNKASKDFSIELEYNGSPAEGFVVGEGYVSPATVNITGAEKTINSISRVVAYYDISDMSHNITEDVSLKLYDSDGKEVKTDLLELSRKKAQINITMLPVKWIDVNYGIMGNPADGYVVTDKNASMVRICVAAEKEKLDNFSSINISEEEFDIEGISEDTIYRTDISKYVPNGYKIVSESTSFELEIKVARRVGIRIPYENIELKGAKDLYDYDIVRENAGIIVYAVGSREVVEKLTVADFYPTVSVAGKNIGTHKIKIDLNAVNDEGYKIEKDMYLTVNITEKPTGPETTEPETTETETTDNSTITEDREETE